MSSTPQTGNSLIQVLHRLQEIELQLASIRRQRALRVRHVEVQKRKIDQVNDRLAEYGRTLRDRQVRLDALTLEVSARESASQKHREALNKAKTNKEYAGILEAMNTEKADAAKIETGVFQLMEEIQTLQTEAGDVETNKLELLDHLKSSQQKLEDFDAERRPKRDKLETDHKEYAANIPPTTLATFVRIAERLDGEAMAPVVKRHPKREEYGCSGCNMTVSLETINTLQSRDEIKHCDSCGRILYYDPSALEG